MSARSGAASATSAASLLRLADPVDPYPSEPSDEDVAAALGLPVSAIVRFDMNTLGGGPLPAVVRAVRDFDAGRLVEYGDQAYRRVRAAISSATGAPAHRIVPGAGADELIRLSTTMVAGSGDAVVVPTPTFPMYGVEARLAGARVVEVPRESPERRQPAPHIRAVAEGEGARLVWLCSPNNPTGDAYAADEIAALTDGLAAAVVVDAVYQEFAEESAGEAPEARSLLALQDRLPNLLILRSLAKSYGLAGARVGYLVVPEEMAARFDAARLPLAIGAASEAAAVAALGDLPAARERRALIVRERERVAQRLENRGWRVLPSLTNFVLVRPPDAGGVAAALLERGLVVRSYTSGPLVDWLRITVRAPRENERLLAVIGA
ncbi:MAG TPA: histidinol-phosphate transaminase [Candidatus Limnocylindria bacterium]|nr:histidinol-phosphate transaminase [Candidatus Limnocylindria bacterium]